MSKYSKQTPVSVQRESIIFMYEQEKIRGGEQRALEMLNQLLSRDPSFLYEQDRTGYTLMHLAASKGYTNLYDLIINHANLQQYNTIESHYLQSLQYNHERGIHVGEAEAANLHKRIEDTHSADHPILKIINQRTDSGYTPGALAARGDHFSIVADLALKGADLTVEPEEHLSSALSQLLSSPSPEATEIALRYVQFYNLAGRLSPDDQIALRNKLQAFYSVMTGEVVRADHEVAPAAMHPEEALSPVHVIRAPQVPGDPAPEEDVAMSPAVNNHGQVARVLLGYEAAEAAEPADPVARALNFGAEPVARTLNFGPDLMGARPDLNDYE